jgi:Uncharacterized conserved protein
MTNSKKDSILNIELKNFGPITHGHIDLKPLTIFIGPNNAGKSYTATLIHSIVKSTNLRRSYNYFSYEADSVYYREMYPRFLNRAYDEKFLNFLVEKIEIEKNSEFKIPDSFVVDLINTVSKSIYENILHKQISHAFACNIRNLIKSNKKFFELKITNKLLGQLSIKTKKEKLEISKFFNGNLEIWIRLNEKRSEIDIKKSGDKFIIEIGRRLLNRLEKSTNEKEKNNIFYSELYDYIMIPIRTALSADFVSYYLPAARSGMLQSHRALAAAVINNAPFIGLKKMEIPELSGVVADFLSSIISMEPREQRPYSSKQNFLIDLSKKFEQELIRGSITLKKINDFAGTEIKYKFGKEEIPLQRASSTVSELAPLFLYLKYLVIKDSLLIIEEPEAHLHPYNISILAKYLVKLIRNGINILITTHSDLLLDQLNNFIMLSKIEPKNLEKVYNYEKDDFLSASEISAYVFEYDKISEGFKILPINISESEGISVDAFNIIHENLYKETLRIKRDLLRIEQ